MGLRLQGSLGPGRGAVLLGLPVSTEAPRRQTAELGGQGLVQKPVHREGK